MKKLNTKGFTVVEGLLIFLIVAIIGSVGWFVVKSRNNTNQSLDNASNSTTATPQTNTSKSAGNTKYFTIKEWNIRAPYSGKYNLSYSIKNDGSVAFAHFSSSELIKAGDQCDHGGGGTIERSAGDTGLDEAGTTPAKSIVNQQPYATAKVGNYYYTFIPKQGICSQDTELQSAVGASVRGLTPKLTAVPN